MEKIKIEDTFCEFTDEFNNDVSFENQDTELAIGTEYDMYYLNKEQFHKFKEWINKQELI